MHQQFPPGRCLSSRRDAGSALHDPRVPCGMLQSLTPQHPHCFFISFAFFSLPSLAASSGCFSSLKLQFLSLPAQQKPRWCTRTRCHCRADSHPLGRQLLPAPARFLLARFSWSMGKKKKVWHGTVERLPNLDLRLSFSVLFQDP